MQRFFLLVLFGSFLFINSTAQVQPPAPIQVMLAGIDHLSQLYNQQPTSDVFSSKKQTEIAQLVTCLQAYAPDMIMVEVEPKEQPRIDSLFALYCTDKLTLQDIPSGRSETYQIGFVLAKRLKHQRVYCVDHYEATSQSLLVEGDNIDIYKQALQHLQTTVRPLKKQVQQDSLSIYQYIRHINQPAMIEMTHYLFYNLPAIVTNGDFSKTALNTVDISHINRRYIGAEFISLFYNRNLKIYSNALTSQQQHQGKKLLMLFGQTHIGVLQELYKANPAYAVVSMLTYCH